jgi:hypothetical protein
MADRCCGKPAGAICVHDVGQATTHFTEDKRLAICEWLAGNGVDPRTVLRDSGFRITVQDGQRIIQYDEYVRDEITGRLLSDPGNPGPIVSRASAPCRVEPPAWLRVPGGPA